jgi:hypothetical protein
MARPERTAIYVSPKACVGAKLVDDCIFECTKTALLALERYRKIRDAPAPARTAWRYTIRDASPKSGELASAPEHPAAGRSRRLSEVRARAVGEPHARFAALGFGAWTMGSQLIACRRRKIRANRFELQRRGAAQICKRTLVSSPSSHQRPTFLWSLDRRHSSSCGCGTLGSGQGGALYMIIEFCGSRDAGRCERR